MYWRLYPKNRRSEGSKIHAKAFNMIRNKDKAKVMTGHILCDCKDK